MVLEAGIVTLFAVGFMLGIEHAFDPDHVTAVSTLVSKTKDIRKASVFGVFWGIGHTMTLLLVGIPILYFKLAVPQSIASGFEFIVGIMLVLLGLYNLRDTIRTKLHEHLHRGHKHIHIHKDKKEHRHHIRHEHKSLMVGMVHGLAGSAALALLVLTTVSSLLLGVFYILVFGIGSILGMLSVSFALSLPLVYASRFERIDKLMRIGVSIISILLGASIMLEVYPTVWS